MVHGLNGELILPVVTIVFLIVSLLSKVPVAARRAGILFGMVALQIFLGVSADDVPQLALLHALNGFGIFAMAFATGQKAAAPVVS